MADAGVTFYNETILTDPTGGDSLGNLNIYYDVSRASKLKNVSLKYMADWAMN